MNRQTLIPASGEGESSFDSFRVGDNAELLAQLRCMVHGTRATRVLYFWGERGSGKTHLLNACCQLARQLGKPNAYLPVHGSAPQPGRIDRIEAHAVACIDDFQAAAARYSWESALLALYEKLRNPSDGGSGALVVAANQPLEALDLGLKDLESRMASGGISRLVHLNDQDKLAALRARARQRGFVLSDSVLQFIITYYRRDTASLFSLLDRIDNASLAQQRKITVPFIKSLL